MRPVAEPLEDRRLFNAVDSLSVIDAQTDQVVMTLNQGDTINLAEFPPNQLTIRANVDQGVESVRFGLDDVASVRVENSPPYALFGDANGNFAGGTFSVGNHKLSATPFSADNATGTIGAAEFMSFDVIDKPVVTNLVLINAQNDSVIKTLNNGDEINLADFPPDQLSIRADVVGSAKSVRFELDASANFRTENFAPYAIFGDNSGDIVGGTFSVGPHDLFATPFTGANATGTEGINNHVTFNVVTNAPPAPPDVNRLLLINADTDRVIQELHDGDSFNRQELPTTNLSVQAVTDGSAGSLKFALDQNNDFRVENFAPYALFGDNPGNDFVGGLFSLGAHTLTATAFSGSNATGIAGTGETVHFTFVDGPVAPQVTGLFLINADDQQVIRELHDDDVINQADLPTQNLNISAVVNGSTESVKFGFDGNAEFRTESFAPYALFGDESGNFVAGTFTDDFHTLTATAFGGDNATGDLGGSLTVDFAFVAGTGT
jgi:hypothetical protein